MTLRAFCERNRCSQSDALRTALTLLSGSTDDDPEATLAAVAVAIGLDETASVAEVQQAFDNLISEQPGTGATEASPSAEAAAPPAPPPGTRAAFAIGALSAAQLKACKKGGIAPADFIKNLASAMKRAAQLAAPSAASAPVVQLTRAELDGCKRLGLTHDEFRARKANAARRIP